MLCFFCYSVLPCSPFALQSAFQLTHPTTSPSSSVQVNPVNEFVERQGIPCYVHDLDTDDMMRRVQLRINKGEGAGVLGRGFGFFSVIQEVMKVIWS